MLMAAQHKEMDEDQQLKIDKDKEDFLDFTCSIKYKLSNIKTIYHLLHILLLTNTMKSAIIPGTLLLLQQRQGQLMLLAHGLWQEYVQVMRKNQNLGSKLGIPVGRGFL